jgi:hypothetical protein
VAPRNRLSVSRDFQADCREEKKKKKKQEAVGLMAIRGRGGGLRARMEAQYGFPAPVRTSFVELSVIGRSLLQGSHTRDINCDCVVGGGTVGLLGAC